MPAKSCSTPIEVVRAASAATSTAEAARPSSDSVKAADAAAGDAILADIKAQKLDATALTVTYDSSTSTATVYGVAPDQATREKIILCAGNVSSVSHVDDRMSVEQSGPEAKFYTVKSGDTLSKICEGILRRCQPVQQDIRSQSTDAQECRQDLPGSGAENSLGRGDVHCHRARGIGSVK